MLRRPALFAFVVFVAVVLVGALVIVALDPFAPGLSAYDRGQATGRVVALPALLGAAGAYFYARRRRDRG